MQVTIELPLPGRVLSPNGSRNHWGTVRRAKKKAREDGRYATMVAMSPHSSARPLWPEATITVRVVKKTSRHRMDDDNLIASLKAYIDGVCDAGLIANDRGLRWGAVEWEVDREAKRESVFLTLTPGDARGE